MKVLITGAAGYIGSILAPIMLERGYEVTALDKFPGTGTSLSACTRYPKFRPVRGDARDAALIRAEVAKHDIIIPLAALVGAPLCARDQIGALTTNYEAIAEVVKCTSANQIILYPTTNSGYGIGAKDSFCTEETPLTPISLYGRTKVDAERLILDSGRGVSLRLATVFGVSPNMRIDLLVNDFTWRAVRDRAVVIFEGQFRRNYIHIRDVAATFLHALDHFETMRDGAYNVGLSSANLSKLELCGRIKLQTPAFVYLESPIGEDPDKRDYIVSNAKLEATGWRPQWSIDEGIAELIRGYAMFNPLNFSNV